MVKFTPRIVYSGLVATVVLGGLVLAGDFPVAALPQRMMLVSQTTVQDYLKRGNQRWGQKDFRGAISDYTEAIRLNPKSSNAYALRGIARGSLGDFQGVIDDTSTAIRLDPKNVFAYTLRGNARSGLGDFQGAINDANTAIRLDPKNAFTYIVRGNARNGLGDFQGAINDANTALRLDPKNVFAYTLRGNARNGLGDFQGAIDDANTAIRLDPKNSAGYGVRGNVRSNLGNQKEAIDDANTAIRLDPKNSAGYEVRSWGYLSSQDYNQALADANTAIQLTPSSSYAFVIRGAAHTGLNNYQEAQRAFDQAIQISQTNADIYYWRGLLRLKQGNNQQAIADYEQAVRLSPGVAKIPAYENYSLIARRQLNTPVASQPALPAPAIKPEPTTTAAVDPPKPTVAPSTPNVYKIAKATTLLIEGQSSGSGVIISKVGNTYFVLTAKHVVQSQQEYTVTTPSGKKYPLDYKQIKKLANLDLAVAQFTSNENLSIAQLGNSETVDQGDVIYVSGWPAEDKAITKRSQFASKGEIAGVQSGNADGYELMYGNSTGPGMSGGPIFNSNGQLVGIHGRAAGNEDIGKVGINLGIPVHLFLRQAPQAGLNLNQLGLRAGK
jgi:tetratricopeptide (TPR) repeat protein